MKINKREREIERERDYKNKSSNFEISIRERYMYLSKEIKKLEIMKSNAPPFSRKKKPERVICSLNIHLNTYIHAHMYILSTCYV